MNKQQIFKQIQNIIFSVRVKKDYLSQFKLKSVSKKELLKDSMTGAGMIEAYQKQLLLLFLLCGVKSML